MATQTKEHRLGIFEADAPKLSIKLLEKEVPHVFHLNIRTEDAKLCSDEECAFFRKYM